jgi:hypothetical protein
MPRRGAGDHAGAGSARRGGNAAPVAGTGGGDRCRGRRLPHQGEQGRAPPRAGARAQGRKGGRAQGREGEGEGEREEGRGGGSPRGFNSGYHRLQNLGHHGRERDGRERLLRGRNQMSQTDLGKGGAQGEGRGARGTRAGPGRAGSHHGLKPTTRTTIKRALLANRKPRRNGTNTRHQTKKCVSA